MQIERVYLTKPLTLLMNTWTTYVFEVSQQQQLQSCPRAWRNDYTLLDINMYYVRIQALHVDILPTTRHNTARESTVV